MSIAPTYPGVYLQEIPSGVRTITGVATSITAFLGRAPLGPVNQPVLISSYGDYERAFGGLSLSSTLSYAVRDFFANGGSQAVVVRLYRNKPDPLSTTDTPLPALSGIAGAMLSGTGTTPPGLTFAAASPGAWGNGLTVLVDTAGITAEIAQLQGLQQADLFNLTVKRGSTVERFTNLSFVDGPRRVDRVLAQQSQLVRCALTAITGLTVTDLVTATHTTVSSVTTASPVALTGGIDSLALDDTTYQGNQALKTGLYALEDADLFNLLCIPPDDRAGDTSAAVYSTALGYCVSRRAVLIVDPPAAWQRAGDAQAGLAGLTLNGVNARNAALYFPRIVEADPLRQGQPDVFAPSGAVAGLLSATDAQRGVWKAPAGLDTALSGIQGPAARLTDADSGQLNPLGINCLRTFPVGGSVIWGARTLRGADQLADEYKYLPVRRLALFIEESLFRGSQWAVFEPNAAPLWAQLRLNIGAFMNNLFRQGAFQGQSPKEAYFVKCDAETTTQTDINLGVVNILVGFAPLKPAEFVIIQLQQMAGQIAA